MPNEMTPPEVGGASRPQIEAVTWLPARDVLGGEASDFTPWLSENLDVLTEAIGLSELSLIATESPVSEKRLDILATGVDDDGQELPVVIENQYGISNHRHLGQLVTYLAQQERGVAVWIVEDYSDAHIAAVEFLNRTSTSDVGYFLARVRFTPGPSGVYQVFFEIAARPNQFVRRGRRRVPAEDATSINLPKKQFLAEIMNGLREPLETVGFKSVAMHKRGAYIDMRLPADLDVAGWTRFTVRATRHRVSVRLHVRGFDSREENSAGVDVLRDRYEKALVDGLPTNAIIEWHGGLQSAETDFVGVNLEGHGYASGDPAKAAGWSRDVSQAWLAVLRNDPILDLKAMVDERLVRNAETE